MRRSGIGPATVDNVEVERFKWAWSEEHGALVWSVSGPGDGRPFHEERVRQAWGRELDPTLGDVFGVATHTHSEGDEPAALSIHVYFGASVPASIVRWFKEAFPSARVPRPPGP